MDLMGNAPLARGRENVQTFRDFESLTTGSHCETCSQEARRRPSQFDNIEVLLRVAD
jgi:hypothetical protein